MRGEIEDGMRLYTLKRATNSNREKIVKNLLDFFSSIHRLVTSSFIIIFRKYFPIRLILV